MRNLLLCMAIGWSSVVAGAAGSWTGEAAPMRLAVMERHYQSAPLQAVAPGSAAAGDHAITSIWWRYTVRPAGLASVELCRRALCVPLATGRGRTEAFAGWSLSEPFYFRASVPGHVRRTVELSDLQLIVNYR